MFGIYLVPISIYKFKRQIKLHLTLFRMGFFRGAHGWGAKKAPFPKIYYTYRTMMKLDTVIPYLKKIQNLYKSLDTSSEFC